MTGNLRVFNTLTPNQKIDQRSNIYCKYINKKQTLILSKTFELLKVKFQIIKL